MSNREQLVKALDRVIDRLDAAIEQEQSTED
jgi:hypothetical protein